MSRTRIGLRNSAVLVAVGAAVAWLAQCGPAPEIDSGVDPALQLRVLDSIGRAVVVPAQRRFAGASLALEQAAQAYAGSLAPGDRQIAQDAWRGAMAAWQPLELMQIGPAAPSTRPGGRWLRDEIYSFPATSRCRIDQVLVAQGYLDLEALAAEPVGVRGLDAIEYLLFVEGAENGCSELGPINTDGSWAALGEDEVSRRRAAYASALATLVRRTAEALVEAWDPAALDFQGQLASPGTGRVYRTPSEALDQVIAAMFYLDLVVKDRKLGAPLGLRDCAAEACPELVESPLAGTSTENVTRDLGAFEALFLGAEPGTDGDGFDDLLASVGQEALADAMRADLAAARASAAASSSRNCAKSRSIPPSRPISTWSWSGSP